MKRDCAVNAVNMVRLIPGLIVAGCLTMAPAAAQSVGLPAPRLLTVTPPGGQAGTTVPVTLTGDHLDDVEDLFFSHPGLTATPQRDDEGRPVPGSWTLSIASDCPPGIHEARVMTRLGVSSARIVTVGTRPEVVRAAANTTLDDAMELPPDTICNAQTTRQAIDHYRFAASAGQRFVIDCSAQGIDSKLRPVLIVADASGQDLQAERRGGGLDFVAPADGSYVVKVHDLTFNGGPEYFYRLVVQTATGDRPVPRLASTRTVSSFSWPPAGVSAEAAAVEHEPNDDRAEAQQITLPCDISGRFFPAADVDVFEFTAAAGDEWWVEIASERLGHPTDPMIVVQRVTGSGAEESVADLAEFHDIPQPVKVSSNGYAYDGPPYHAGSPDIIGRIAIPEDGRYRLLVSDLFGGTRSVPEHAYRLIVRRPAPDFAIVGWALHMELRNGDRNALSKPVALRHGATVAFEVVAVRRDGFDGPIDLALDNLPEGITATGLRIPAGQTRGVLLMTASEDAPRGRSSAVLRGTAVINGEQVTRTGHMASLAWPVPDSWREIPSPRLLEDFCVSTGAAEPAPLTIAAAADGPFEVTAGQSLTIPLSLVRRCEFSGASFTARTLGGGFDAAPPFTIPLDKDATEITFDTARLKTPPGDYVIALCGGAVAKYRDFPQQIPFAEAALERARQHAASAAAESQRLVAALQAASDAQKAELRSAAESADTAARAAREAVTRAEQALDAARKRAAPRDIAEIIVSSPIRVRVTPAP